MVKLSWSKNMQDYLIAGLSGLVGALTLFANMGSVVSVPVIASCAIVFLNAIIDVNKS